MRHSFTTLITLIVGISSVANVSAVPHGHRHSHHHHRETFNLANDTYFDLANVELDRRQDGDKPLLRLMPLGASITQGISVGIPENQQNGYRKLLRDQLRYLGYPVNMIGSRSHGTFKDRQHEGWPGLKITEVAEHMVSTLTRQKPNLVLINLGTNDCMQADDRNYVPLPGGIEFVKGTKDRLKTVVEKIFAESEGVTIILSTLLMTLDTTKDGYIQTANLGYKALVSEMQAQGHKIELADMYTGWFTSSDYSDLVHPTPDGYRKMAAVWADAFRRVEQKGWLIVPIDTGVPSGGQCYPSPDGFRGPIKTQQGSGYDDANYRHSSVLESEVGTYYGLAPRSLLFNHFHFADIVKFDGEEHHYDEFIRVLDPEDRSLNNLPYISYNVNRGGVFGPGYIKIDVGPECLSRGVRWGDVNGDGLDDFICVNPEGTPFVSLNRGGNPPKFEYMGSIREDIFKQADVRLADVDGDGRLDFCGLKGDGSMDCHRGGGLGDLPVWQGMLLDGGGSTFDANPIATDNSGVRLVDINGDGRADWIYINPDTSTEIYINQRGSRDDGKGLKPHWVKVEQDIEGWPDDKSVNRTHILFGRVFGSGRADLIRIEEVKSTGSSNDYKFHYHRNTGEGGTKVKGDGAHYCDMFGRGYDDYLWVWGGGMIDLFENLQSPPSWKDHGRIFETGKDRKWLHFGDWDGDGLCDILYVDRATGNVDMWRNLYKQGQDKPTFAAAVRVSGSGLCPQPIINPNPNDLAVRFGDLDGDGRVDYICMDPNGRSRGWLNKAGGLTAMSPNQIKVSVGFERPGHRWADVNGDGKVDFLWVDKHTGNVQCWINGGIQPALDSSMYWDEQRDIWMAGAERGGNIHFPKLSASGRADYHWVHPQKNFAYTYFNECEGGGGVGEDDGPITDPQLPAVPGGGSNICPRATKCGDWPSHSHVIALGDSYSAGPGAGNRITNNAWDPSHKCFQGSNANPQYLFDSEPGLSGTQPKKTFDFISCTGDKIEDVMEKSSKDRGLSQLGLLARDVSRADYSLMLYSIGGNDVGFGPVAINCLFVPGRTSACAKKMDFAEKAVMSGQYSIPHEITTEYSTLFDRLKESYRRILNSPTAAERYLIVTGYGKFFNDEDQSGTQEDCAKYSLSVSNTLGPKLTLDLRRRINAAVGRMNEMIQSAIEEVKPEFPMAKIRFVDIDPFFNGWRWCDKDNGELRDFDRGMMFVPYAKDWDMGPDGAPALPPLDDRDEPEGGPTLGDDVGDVDCNSDDLDDAAAWFCGLTEVNSTDNYNCDQYPDLCVLKDRKRSPKDWTQWPMMKSAHPKSFIHKRTAEYIRTMWPTWQKEADGCPCSDE